MICQKKKNHEDKPTLHYYSNSVVSGAHIYTYILYLYILLLLYYIMLYAKQCPTTRANYNNTRGRVIVIIL